MLFSLFISMFDFLLKIGLLIEGDWGLIKNSKFLLNLWGCSDTINLVVKTDFNNELLQSVHVAQLDRAIAF